MTWKEIKEVIERAGVKDSDEIVYIDIRIPSESPLDVTVYETADGEGRGIYN